MFDGLTMLVGSAKSFSINIVDDKGFPEDISQFIRAQFTIRDGPGDTPILSRDSGSGNLTIDSTNSLINISLSQAEADALPLGVWNAGVRFQALSGHWEPSENFRVKIVSSYAETV